MTRKRKQCGGDDEADGDATDDDDKLGDEGSAIRAGDGRPDTWVCRGRDLSWTREHRTPGRQLFHPAEADRGPSNVNQLWCLRKTTGIMEDGRKFNVTDDWTNSVARQQA